MSSKCCCEPKTELSIVRHTNFVPTVQGFLLLYLQELIYSNTAWIENNVDLYGVGPEIAMYFVVAFYVPIENCLAPPLPVGEWDAFFPTMGIMK